MTASANRLVALTAALVLTAPGATPPAAAEDPLPRVPPGFAVTPYSAIGGTGTSLAFGPDTRTGRTGTRLYVADNAGNRVMVIDDLGGVGSAPAVYATGFGGPLGVLVAADGTMYVADAEGQRAGPFGNRVYGRVWRVRDTNGDGTGDLKEVVLKDLPNGRHNTNGMAFGPDGMLYVANGNSTDDGIDGGSPEVVPWSGSAIRVDPGATNVSLADLPQDQALVAHGWRNVYDLAFSPVDPTLLFIPMNGADDATQGATGDGITGPIEDSDDLLYATDIDDTTTTTDEAGNLVIVPRIDDFGFPSCLYNVAKKGDMEPYQNPNGQTIQRFGACPTLTVPRPVSSFGLHVSADGLAFQSSAAWGEDYRNDLFVAEFGNFFGVEPVGHEVVRVELDQSGSRVERQSEFLSGAVPLDLTFDAAGAMYVLDFSGTIFKVTRPVQAPGEVEVLVSGFQFVPQALVVPEGTVVRWVNDDAAGLPHTVSGQASITRAGPGDGGELESPTFSPGQSFTYRFDEPGTWVYTCVFNPTHEALMHGNVTVVPAGG